MFFGACRQGIETLDPECAKVLLQNKQHIGLFDFERVFQEVGEKRRYAWTNLSPEENHAYQEKIDKIWNPFFFPKPFQKLSSCEDMQVTEDFFILGIEYAIGRHSYVLSDVSECVKENIHNLSDSALNQILCLIESYLKDCKEAQQVSPDIKVWESVQKALSKKLNIGFFTLQELEKTFGYHKTSLLRLALKGIIPSIKVNNRRLLDAKSVKEYVERRAIKTGRPKKVYE